MLLQLMQENNIVEDSADRPISQKGDCAEEQCSKGITALQHMLQNWPST